MYLNKVLPNNINVLDVVVPNEHPQTKLDPGAPAVKRLQNGVTREPPRSGWCQTASSCEGFVRT